MDQAWYLFSTALTAAYAALLGAYYRGWKSLPVWQMPAGFRPRTRISVVVPARNEAANIGACLDSILRGDYPPGLLEIIVVDDFSTDDTAAIVGRLAANGQHGASLRLVRLAELLPADASFNAYKKIALETAVARASGELIVTTDADCLAAPGWLRLIASVYEARAPKAIAAPVVFHREKNLLQRFQALDFLGMMGITGAGIRLGWQRLGNGANLAYPKAVFEALGGYGGNAPASGDDLFLLQKIARRWPQGVFFLKNADAAVRTEAPADWRAFVGQRLRWGTKNAALPEPGPKLALLAVLLFCWSILLNLALWPGRAGGCLPAVQLIVKGGCDWLFLREMSRFFRRSDLMRFFLPAFFLHIAYIAGIGVASLFARRYEWKGRRVH